MTHTLPSDAGSFVTQYYIHILTTVNVREKQVHLLEVKVMGL